MGNNEELIGKIRTNIHDVNNHLTIVKGKSEKLLMDDTLKDNIDLQKILDRSDKAARLMSEIRELVHNLS